MSTFCLSYPEDYTVIADTSVAFAEFGNSFWGGIGVHWDPTPRYPHARKTKTGQYSVTNFNYSTEAFEKYMNKFCDQTIQQQNNRLDWLTLHEATCSAYGAFVFFIFICDLNTVNSRLDGPDHQG